MHRDKQVQKFLRFGGGNTVVNIKLKYMSKNRSKSEKCFKYEFIQAFFSYHLLPQFSIVYSKIYFFYIVYHQKFFMIYANIYFLNNLSSSFFLFILLSTILRKSRKMYLNRSLSFAFL